MNPPKGSEALACRTQVSVFLSSSAGDSDVSLRTSGLAPATYWSSGGVFEMQDLVVRSGVGPESLHF